MRKFCIAAITVLLSATTLIASPAITIKAPGEGNQIVSIQLTQDELEALESRTYTTSNPYVNAPTEFTGPLLRDLLQQFDLTGVEALRLRAINDYAVTIPVQDIVQYDVIVAYAANGEPMSVREKGPLWVMYPISDNPELDDPIFHSRLIWQLVAIEAE